MKGHYATLALGALLLLAAAQPTHSQTAACFIDNSGFVWDLILDTSTDTFSGAVDVGDPGGLWFVMGARGTNGRTKRAHVLTAINGDLASAVGCDDGEGYVDFFTYNGLTGAFNGSGYPYSGDWYNACGGEGTFSGTIFIGACRAQPRPVPSPGGPATATATSAATRTTPEGYSVTSTPNPSSDDVAITFEIPEVQHVRLAVYDMLGREVTVLVDEEREAGSHAVSWEASSLPAGTYLYRIEAGAYTEAKPLVLVR
jgi:hypothetical protein